MDDLTTSAEAKDTNKEEAKEDSQGVPEPLKLPPCDQCRRRKVKCDGIKVPCER